MAEGITDQQKRFLVEFAKKGNIDDALETLKLQQYEFISWRNNYPDFRKTFATYSKEVMRTLREQSALRAMQIIHHDLMEGCIRLFEQKTIVKKGVDAEGEEVVIGTETHIIRKEHPLPPMHFKIALESTTFERAINELCSTGALPPQKADMLLAEVDSMTDRLQKIMSDDKVQSEGLTEQKMTDIVKYAVMQVITGGV